MKQRKSSGRTAVRLKKEPSKPGGLRLKTAPDGAPKRGDDVRLRVMNAALEYFGAFGYDGTTTRAIAERANVTHSLILYHFGSKERLWFATMELALSSLVTGVAEVREAVETESADALLRRLIEMLVRLHAERPQIHRIMTMEGHQHSARLDWIIDNFLRDHFSLWRDLIRRGQLEGTVRECDPARLYYLIISVGGTPFSLPTEYKALTGRDVFSEAEILRNIAFLYEIVFTGTS